MKGKKAGIVAVVLACVASLVVLGCSNVAEQADVPKSENKAEYVEALYEPEVVELEDGTLVQRTPTEGAVLATLDTSYTYHTPEKAIPYNTYFLNADDRGCHACHDDLAQLLVDSEYPHTDLRNNFGIQITVDMCKDCHTFGYGYITNQNQFGDMIHMIHDTEDKAYCWNCHAGNGDGEGMQLWDEVKYNNLRGITAIADVKGEFDWNQDKTTPISELFDFDWNYFEYDYLRHDNTVAQAPLDEKMFNEWTITVSGAVKKETTWTLPEMIEKFESVSKPITFHCTLNPTGGPFLGNPVYTGVKISDLLDAAGWDPDNVGAIGFFAPDGFAEYVMADNFDKDFAMVAYESEGERLPWSQGYPAQSINPHSAAPQSVKNLSDIVVYTKEEAEDQALREWNGWPNETEGTAYYTPGNWPYEESAGFKNKPNIGLFDFIEGTIVKTGEPYTFNGYAAAYDEQIVGVEFSMDGGVTWTRYDTPNSDPTNWVIWDFTYTPEVDSAYVLMMRAVTDKGLVTEDPITVLFNAKSA